MAAITTPKFSNAGRSLNWQTIMIVTLGFWLSGSLILDLVMMPSLYVAGMMTQPGFASAGYMLFGAFNRIEILCGALALTGSLVLINRMMAYTPQERKIVLLSVLLLGVALIETYILTPQMSAMGLNLNWFEPLTTLPSGMVTMQIGYWGLEIFKLIACGSVIWICYSRQALGISKID